MVSTSEFKKGLKILIDNEPYVITDFQHVKPGKGNQFTRTKLKHLINDSNLERTIKSGEKFPVPDVHYQNMNFLYKDETGFNFMDQTSFEQFSLSEEVLGDAVHFLIENMEVNVCIYNDRAVGVELPNSVVLRVTQTDPGLKGNTVTNTFKPATLETGYVVQVPLHINEGDTLKIDTRSGEYVGRVNE
ncbi:MAG: elongation factor P [Bdellovibrionaceae bacterium]|nr:elongation factor P [Bdellovibrionales bacterium]MCB9082801.1 elongation factor P [Pseudobdellovibrionaceae bacterium]